MNGGTGASSGSGSGVQLSSEARVKALPCWQGRPVIEPLSGGISNENWKVRDMRGTHVVRLGADYPFHHVERAHELMVARAAHGAGFSPAVEHAEPGVMVTAWIDAHTYGAADVRANAERVLDLLKRFHNTMPQHVSGAARMFWVFHVIRDYARTLKAGDSRMMRWLPGFIELAAELEAEQIALPVIFGHHDLLPANFLDDGERLWLIDFEYAGFGTAMFDLAGFSSNAGFSADDTEALLQAYFGRAADEPLARAMSAMQCASLLREAMWSMVSELHLAAPGVDYQAYTSENLEKLDAALAAHRSAFAPL
jgi:thiamine kinase-like enzyme